jgi:DNA-binding MarR family transcriptional regulator
MNPMADESADNLASLAEALRPALLRAARQLRRAALKSGVSALDEQVLHAIKLNPGIGVSELAERERMSRPSMSSHVKRLRALDWVSADQTLGDGRRVGLSLSATGKTALAAIRRRRNDWLSGRLATLSDSDRRALAAAAAPLLALSGER